MSTRAEQKERTRQEILASAVKLLRERGIHGASVADVMRGAGLTVGGFYAHFASKEALVSDALREAIVEVRGRLLGGLDGKAPAERLEMVLRRYLSRAHRDEVDTGCPLPAVVSEIGTGHADVGAALSRELDEFAAALEELGGPITESPKTRAGLGLVALMFGGLSLSRAVRGTPMSDEILSACVALGRAALRGLAAEAQKPAE
jgi:TetR/AcrR family transcriptional repressor of nem operon